MVHAADFVAQQVVDEPLGRDIRCTELFAGVASVAAGFRARGHKSLTFDYITRSPEQDITSVMGLLLGVLYVLRVQKHGLLFMGVPCCNFTWKSSSVHGRAASTPFGNLNPKPS